MQLTEKPTSCQSTSVFPSTLRAVLPSCMALGTAVMVSIEAILIIAAGAATAPVPKIAASANRLDLLATAKKLSLPVCELRFLGSEPFLSLNQEALAFQEELLLLKEFPLLGLNLFLQHELHLSHDLFRGRRCIAQGKMLGSHGLQRRRQRVL